MKKFVALGAFALLALSACTKETVRTTFGPGGSQQPQTPGANIIQLTILGTNDIHGGIEATQTKDGAPIGGLAFYSGVVKSIRSGLTAKVGADGGGVLVLDAGDQFQGTLLSNFDEGKLIFSAMSEIGYDAAVPGNHDYDFGPVGWMVDQVASSSEEASLRGALRETIKQAKFPLLSANTFFKSSMVDSSGQAIPVDGTRCAPVVPAGQTVPLVDWSKAQTLDFLKPYLIKEIAGVKVAVIGIDFPSTPTVTTPHNVSDLCFADEAESYLRVRAELDGKADVFVMVIHNGDINADTNVTKLLGKLTTTGGFKKGAPIDAVIAGHTHQVNNILVGGVPAVQSGAGGKLFGRIDLFYDRAKGKVDTTKTRRFAGVQLLGKSCDPAAEAICTVDAVSGDISYDGVKVVPSAKVLQMIADRRREIAPIAGRRLGTANTTIGPYGDESPLGDGLTDFLRATSGAEIAFMNAGGIRAPLNPRALPNQPILYEDLFQVLPFSNHGVVLGPMSVDKVVSILMRNARSCAGDGRMVESGLKVQIARKCKDAQGNAVPADELAVLTRVETVAGEVVVENNQISNPGRVFQVATLDFLQAGGSGYTQFTGIPLIRDMGIVRDVIADLLIANPVTFSSSIDGRWKIVDRSAAQ